MLAVEMIKVSRNNRNWSMQIERSPVQGIAQIRSIGEHILDTNAEKQLS